MGSKIAKPRRKLLIPERESPGFMFHDRRGLSWLIISTTTGSGLAEYIKT
jgi:hypothetical protein